MSISDMSTEKAFECMTRMVPYVVEIANDPDVAEMKKKLRGEEGELTGGDFMKAVYPILMSKHRESLFGIVAAMTDKTVDEVRNQPYKETFATIKSGFDKELFDFFPFAARLVVHA